MESEDERKFILAGRIAAEVRDEAMAFVRPGMKILDLAERIEKLIMEKKAMPAFPPNISINDIAAHYTPRYQDDREIGEGEIVKIDIGVHIGGYIGDLAATYCSRKNDMVDAAEKVLAEAVKIARPGTKVGEIGSLIEQTAEDLGYGVIANLTGHGIEKDNFHAEPTIPNVRNSIQHELAEGDVIAIEPFICERKGIVKETGTTEIFRYLQDRPVRMDESRKILRMAKSDFSSLPFAKRWLCRYFSTLKISLALKELQAVNALEAHPVLKEATGMKISQAEHTIIVKDKSIITTKI
ncbi:MAG: type II methionyl aminopeptidase [Candidatus Aenigmarchaeota archaeon]|nr:type II methionyl aminopeptidase [Candidatus Aenigmarchaeota archaeon]